MNEGAYRALANSWDEEGVIACAAKDYDQRPNRERVQKMTCGFLKRVFGSTLWGETLLMRGISVEVHGTFRLLHDLNHEPSLALRNWSRTPSMERRAELKDWLSSGRGSDEHKNSNNKNEHNNKHSNNSINVTAATATAT